jgi:hypothetical protein
MTEAPDVDRGEVWARRADHLAAENDRLRQRIAELERTVRILRVQLPLIRLTLDADPDGPDPRWAARIPAPRPASAPVTRTPVPAPGSPR